MAPVAEKTETPTQTCKYSIASSVLCGVALLLAVVALKAPSFDATYQAGGHSCEISASLHSLHSCQGDAISIWNFCGEDHSTCHNDKCQDLQDTFCDLHAVSFVTYYISLVGLVLALAMGCAYRCILPKQSWHLAANVISCILIVSTALYVLMLPIWGAAKGELPDLTADNRWVYLPDDTPKMEEWGVTWGFGLAFVVAVVACASAGCARMNYYRLLEMIPAEELVELGLEGAVVPNVDAPAVAGEVRLHLDEPSPVESGATAKLEAAGVPSYPPSETVDGGMKPLNAPATPDVDRVEIKTTE